MNPGPAMSVDALIDAVVRGELDEAQMLQPVHGIPRACHLGIARGGETHSNVKTSKCQNVQIALGWPWRAETFDHSHPTGSRVRSSADGPAELPAAGPALPGGLDYAQSSN